MNKNKSNWKIWATVFTAIFAILTAISKPKKSDAEETGKDSIKKGDKVEWDGKRYSVEGVSVNYKDGQNLYALCRMEAVEDGTKMLLKCIKLLAREEELRKVD